MLFFTFVISHSPLEVYLILQNILLDNENNNEKHTISLKPTFHMNGKRIKKRSKSWKTFLFALLLKNPMIPWEVIQDWYPVRSKFYNFSNNHKFRRFSLSPPKYTFGTNMWNVTSKEWGKMLNTGFWYYCSFHDKMSWLMNVQYWYSND